MKEGHNTRDAFDPKRRLGGLVCLDSLSKPSLGPVQGCSNVQKKHITSAERRQEGGNGKEGGNYVCMNLITIVGSSHQIPFFPFLTWSRKRSLGMTPECHPERQHMVTMKHGSGSESDRQ